MVDNEINILFLGGAKRVSVGRMLIDAAAKRGYKARIYGYELESRVPLAAIGEIITGKRWGAAAFQSHLHDTVESHGINILLPFVDGAIEPVAEYIKYHPEVFSPVSEPAVAGIFFDKVLSAEAFEKAGLPIPATCHPGEATTFPLIAKPRRGSASKGIMIIHDIDGLRQIDLTGYIVQEYVEDATEITVDCYISRAGHILAVSPRERLETAGGEAVRTITIDSPEAVVLAEHTIESLSLRGAVTVQLLRDKYNHLKVMEINPRLGGGVVASVKAGANIPALIIDEYLSLPLNRVCPIPGVLTARYLEEIVFLPDGTKI